MISDLSEQQDENLTLADYVKYYCRVDLRNDPSLSTKVCRVCRLYIETFITFCEHLNRAEKNSIQREVKIKFYLDFRLGFNFIFSKISES